MNKRHLILGAATGYTPEQILPFVNSLRKSGFAGTTALFVDKSNRAIQQYLQEVGIIPIPLTRPPWWIPGPVARRILTGGRIRHVMNCVHHAIGLLWALVPPNWRPGFAVTIVAPFHHIWDSRRFYTLQFLHSHQSEFSHVLLTDVRDVVFQSDPFSGIPDHCLWFFQDGGNETISQQVTNRTWVESAFGIEGLKRIGANPCLCAGTLMGSTDLVLKYLTLMTDHIIGLRGKHQLDQAIHNWLFWTGCIPKAEVKRNFHGPIVSLSLEPADQFAFDGQGRLLNKNGSVIAVLHHNGTPDLPWHVV